MPFEIPKKINELVYFTRRAINSGYVVAWVPRKSCPECGGFMGKPIDPRTKKVKTRARKYVCRSCGYSISSPEYEQNLTCYIKYTCPSCRSSGELAIPFKRKLIKVTDPVTGKRSQAQALIFNCERCGHRIEITKRMK